MIKSKFDKIFDLQNTEPSQNVSQCAND